MTSSTTTQPQAHDYPVDVSFLVAQMTADLRALDGRRDLVVEYVAELRVLAEHVASIRDEIDRVHGAPVPAYLS